MHSPYLFQPAGVGMQLTTPQRACGARRINTAAARGLPQFAETILSNFAIPHPQHSFTPNKMFAELEDGLSRISMSFDLGEGGGKAGGDGASGRGAVPIGNGGDGCDAGLARWASVYRAAPAACCSARAGRTGVRLHPTDTTSRSSSTRSWPGWSINQPSQPGAPGYSRSSDTEVARLTHSGANAAPADDK